MTDERQRADDKPGPDQHDPELDREDVKDLTPSEEDAGDVRGGARCACTDSSGAGGVRTT